MQRSEERVARLVAMEAALRTPALISSDLQSLLRPAPITACAAESCDARATVLAAHAALRFLARLRTGYWRSTCLYLSVAECIALRRMGFPARLVIGARVENLAGLVAAHAWVECAGMECVSQPASEQFEVLTGAAVAVLP